MVGLDATEAHGSEDSMKGSVPNSTSLLEAIERLYEPANIFWSTHLKSFRLLHVDLLFQNAIEISMRDVYRAKLQVLLQCCNAQNGANGGIANSGSKGLLEVKARLLRIAFGDDPALVTVQGAISIVLDLQEPSGANCTLPRREFDDLPSAIQSVSLHLFLTCCTPQICVRMLLGLLISSGLNRGG
jgi:hypothetical protein